MKLEEQKAQQCVRWLALVEERAKTCQSLCGSLNVSPRNKDVQAAWREADETMRIHCDIYDDLAVSEPQFHDH